MTDSKGITFDPKIHESKDGKPVITQSGAYRLKRGRKAGTSTKPVAAETVAVESPATPAPTVTVANAEAVEPQA